MAEEKVSKRILEDAKKKAGEVGEEARRRAKAIEEQAGAEVKETAEKSEAEALEAAAREKERLIALAKLELRKSLLAEKQNLIDGVFEGAVSSLNSLKKEKYQELVKRLLLEAVETGDEEVVVSPGEKWINQKFLANVGKELAGGRSLKLSKEQREMRGGFILKRGRVEVKASFDSLVNELRDELEIEVARLLFG